jgi:hypothetical protein
MSSPPSPPRRSWRTPLALGAAAVAALAVVALLATGHLNARLVPPAPEKPAPTAVQCFEADGSPLQSWSAAGAASPAPSAARVDPLAVCRAVIQDAAAVAQLDAIATQQGALGRSCVHFDASDGGRWQLTGLTSADKTYVLSGGPAPGRLPGYGEVSQPAPLASLAPATPSAGECIALPTVRWDLSVPPLVACTGDDLTVSVYVRARSETASALCSREGLVVSSER